jgi:hypothetical protein
MNREYLTFLQGISACGAWVGGLIFLRFWRESRDPLFGFFGAAFWLLSLSWALLALTNPTEEARPYIYALRLIAFVLIIAAMVVKNRGSRT